MWTTNIIQRDILIKGLLSWHDMRVPFFQHYFTFILLNCDRIYVWNVISVYFEYLNAYIYIYHLHRLINYDALVLYTSSLDRLSKSLVNEKNWLHNVNIFNSSHILAIMNSNICFFYVLLHLDSWTEISLPTPQCCNWPNSNINVSLMWARIRVIFTVPNKFYLHKKVLKNSSHMFIAFWITRFLQETLRIITKSPMVKWSALF